MDEPAQLETSDSETLSPAPFRPRPAYGAPVFRNPDSFLNRILNDIYSDNSDDRPVSSSASSSNMPPTTKRASRQNQASRLEITDQDQDEIPDSGSQQQPRKRRRLSRESAARTRRTVVDEAEASGSGSSNSNAPGENVIMPIEIEDVENVTEESKMGSTLQKQRADQILSQQDIPNGRSLKFGEITCVICMDNPTDLTATACGHVFCHECLMQAIIASENRGPDSRKGQCPVCRKTLSRTKHTAGGLTDFTPLLLKKALRTASQKERVR